MATSEPTKTADAIDPKEDFMNTQTLTPSIDVAI